MRTTLRVAALLLALSALVVGPPARAGDGAEAAERISQQVMSPFCEGLTLHECPSDAARALRDRIAAWAADGWSDARIMQALEDEYGPSIRAVPSDRSGFVVWLLPALALAAGGALALLLARRWTKRRALLVQPAAVKEESPEDRSRLDAELGALRNEVWGPGG